MIVSTLIEALQTIDPNARVHLASFRNPDTDEAPETATGDIVLISVTQIDGTDVRVFLSNCVADADGINDFKAKPQFMRTKISLGQGTQAAAADLEQQLSKQATTDLDEYLEVEQVKNLFRALHHPPSSNT